MRLWASVCLLALIFSAPLMRAASAQTLPDTTSSIIIESARRFRSRDSRDVTDVVRGLVSGDSLTLENTPEAFPDGNPQMELELKYRRNGQPTTTTLAEGGRLQLGSAITSFVRTGRGILSVAGAVAELRKKYPTGLLVLDARWSGQGGSKDVTDDCQHVVSGDSLTIPASAEAFGEPWNSANLRITYYDGKEAKSTQIGEGNTLQIGDRVTSFVRYHKGLVGVDQAVAELRKKYPSGLLILDARWGGNAASKDVTDDCQRAVSGDSLTVPAVAEAFDQGWSGNCYLRVTYFDGHDVKSTQTAENGTLQIGEKVTAFVRNQKGLTNVDHAVAELRKKYPSGLLVLDARWNRGNGWKDVTDDCQRLVSGNSLTIPVGTEAFGEGWSGGSSLRMTYYDGDELKTNQVAENSTLQIGDRVTSFLRLHKGLVAVDQAVAELRQQYPTGLLVLDARWGRDGAWKDVTDDCQRVVWGDSLTVPNVPAAFHESDGSQKQLLVTYFDGQSLKTTNAGENGSVQIGEKTTSFLRKDDGLISIQKAIESTPTPSPNTPVILNATYGTQNATVDVRNFLQSRLNNARLPILVGDDSWPDSGDRDKKAEKFASVLYWDGSKTQNLHVPQGERLEFVSAAPSVPKAVSPKVASSSPAASSSAGFSSFAPPWILPAAGGILAGFLIGIFFPRKRSG